jgi:hypothetical protein
LCKRKTDFREEAGGALLCHQNGPKFLSRQQISFAASAIRSGRIDSIYHFILLSIKIYDAPKVVNIIKGDIASVKS